MMAVLAVPYGPEAKSDSRPDTLEIAMIEGAGDCSRCGRAARTSRTVCMRSTLRLCCQFSSVSGIARALTFATTTSSPPYDAADPSTQAARASPSPTSTTVPVTSPRPPSASWVALTSPASRAQNPTVAPSSRNASTTARPMPRVPPVTRTRVPLSCRSMAGPFAGRTGRTGSGRAERGGAGPQVGVQAAERLRGRKQRLRRLDHDAVVGVDDVRDRDLRDLGAQLVGVHRVQAVQLGDPVDELGVADPPGVLHRAAGADGHPVRVVLDAGPGRRPALDEFHDEGGGHRSLDGGAAGFPLALAVVTVTDREQRPLDVHAEEDGRAGPHLGGVHVAAEPVGHQGRAHLAAGGCHPDRAEHRRDGELDAVVAVPGHEGHGVAVAVELVD